MRERERNKPAVDFGAILFPLSCYLTIHCGCEWFLVADWVSFASIDILNT